MKKHVLTILCAALALVGCQQNRLTPDGQAGTYTFTVSTDQLATKAAVDNDGNGAGINRFIMEVYIDNGKDDLVLFDRQVSSGAAISGSTAQTSFNLTLIKGKEYKVLFWADCADDGKDLYYKTDSVYKNVYLGLRAVSLIADKAETDTGTKADANPIAVTGGNDARDAFQRAVSISSKESTNGFTKTVKLVRPFAQLNFITTDIPALMETSSTTDFIPDKVTVNYKGYTTFNVLDSTAVNEANFSYTAKVYSASNPKDSPANYTLSMDYILTKNSEDKDVQDVSLIALKDTYQLTEVKVSSCPLKRNYRTNVIGTLLTSSSEFVVEVSPDWTGELNKESDGVSAVVSTIEDVQDLLNEGITDITLDNPLSAPGEIVLPASNDGEKVVEYNITLPDGNDQAVTFSDAEGSTSESVVNITASNNTGEVIINLPNSHVTLNGEEYGAVNVEATSYSTLVVEKGVHIKELTIAKGGLEIHGTVDTVTVKAVYYSDVIVRECEGLSASAAIALANYMAVNYQTKLNDEGYYIYKYYDGEGTEDDPLIVNNVNQFINLKNADILRILKPNKIGYSYIYTNNKLYVKLGADIDFSPFEKSSLYTKITEVRYAIFNNLYNVQIDGAGHTFSLPKTTSIAYQPYYLDLKDLKVVINDSPIVYWQVFPSVYDHVDVYGNMSVSGNHAAYMIYSQTSVTFNNCTSHANLVGQGGSKDYNSVFIGYLFNRKDNESYKLAFNNCENAGSLVCGRASMFVGNNLATAGTVSLTVNNCKNTGTLVATSIESGYNFNYYVSIGNMSFKLNDIAVTASDIPNATEDALGYVVNENGTVYNGPVDTGMELTLNDDGSFNIIPPTDNAVNGTAVTKLQVGLGLYVRDSYGTNRVYVSENIAVDESASYTSKIKNYKFVDKAYVAANADGVSGYDGVSDKEGDEGHEIFTLNGETYYVISDVNGQYLGSNPSAASIYYLSAYDANGNLLGSVSLGSSAKASAAKSRAASNSAFRSVDMKAIIPADKVDVSETLALAKTL